MAQIEYRFLSAGRRHMNATATYVPVGHPSLPRSTREPLDQYPYLRGLALGWLDGYDDPAIEEADAFVTGHGDGIDAERAGHDLSVYLCNWVVAHDDAAQWVLQPKGTCYVELGDDWLGPLPARRHVHRRSAGCRATVRRQGATARREASNLSTWRRYAGRDATESCRVGALIQRRLCDGSGHLYRVRRGV